jgi:hypothetical protein
LAPETRKGVAENTLWHKFISLPSRQMALAKEEAQKQGSYAIHMLLSK